MIAYLDASVVLRLVLGEPTKLAEWKRVRTAVGSATDVSARLTAALVGVVMLTQIGADGKV